MRFGQVKLFLNTVTQTDVKPLATAKGNKRLGQLVAGAVRVLPRVKKAGQALQAVRRCRGEGVTLALQGWYFSKFLFSH